MSNIINFKGIQQEYHFENIHLYRADCMEMLPQIQDKKYNLTIADPPYGWKNPNERDQQALNFRYKNKTYKNTPPTQSFFDQIQRISENQIIWGGNYFADKLPISRCWISWYKGQPLNSFSDFELAWTSFNQTSRAVKLESYGPVHADKKQTGKVLFATQKPISLYKWQLQRFAKVGDKILDTHLGGGSIIIACYLMGFELTAFEIEESTFNDTVARFEKFKKRPKGFFNESEIFKID
jgi:site-specific DNA-methyltransferase (adenine-specific)